MRRILLLLRVLEYKFVSSPVPEPISITSAFCCLKPHRVAFSISEAATRCCSVAFSEYVFSADENDSLADDLSINSVSSMA